MFVIENVLLDTDSESLTLISADGDVLKFELEGDCCSHSYFDEDSKIDARDLLGDTLTAVQYNYINAIESDYGETKHYALIIKTNRQSISLMWRNDSNGYYSGTVNLFLNDSKLSYGYEESLNSLGVVFSYGNPY